MLVVFSRSQGHLPYSSPKGYRSEGIFHIKVQVKSNKLLFFELVHVFFICWYYMKSFEPSRARVILTWRDESIRAVRRSWRSQKLQNLGFMNFIFGGTAAEYFFDRVQPPSYHAQALNIAFGFPLIPNCFNSGSSLHGPGHLPWPPGRPSTRGPGGFWISSSVWNQEICMLLPCRLIFNILIYGTVR